MKKFLMVLVCMTVLFSTCVSKAVSGDEEVVVSSYIRTWTLAHEDRKGSPNWNADMVNASYLTDLNIAFALIDGSDFHTIYIPELRSLMFPNIWQEVTALKKRLLTRTF
jgi:hypothetical protein